MENTGTDRDVPVIDLTGSDDTPVNPLVAKESSPRKRKSPGSRNYASGEDEGIEVVSVNHVDPSSRAGLRQRRRIGTEQPYSEDEFLVVNQKTLTPEERLRRVQEKHARGETVATSNLLSQRRSPMAMASFGARHAVHGGLLAPHTFHPYLSPPTHNHTFFPFAHTGNSLFDMLTRSRAGNLEQSIINSTLENSMNEMDNRKKLDVASLLLPPEPSETPEGFTRSLSTESELLCVKCNQPLGKANPDSMDSNSLRQKVFARGCGHAYCGDCTYAMKKPATKKGAKACPVAKCQSIPPRRLKIFREVFL